MSRHETDTKQVTCPVCKTVSFYLPTQAYRFYSEHYYLHKLEAQALLQEQQDKYEGIRH